MLKKTDCLSWFEHSTMYICTMALYTYEQFLHPSTILEGTQEYYMRGKTSRTTQQQQQ